MENNINEAFSALKVYLQENFKAKTASGGKEIVKRCHLCGDSRDISDAHMYIGVRDGKIFYNCFKCNSSGLVDGAFLRNMGCYDLNLILLVKEQNARNTNSNYTQSNISQNFKNKIIKNCIIPVDYNESNEYKLQYLENRIGVCITNTDAPKFKIILNLKDFLSANCITYYTRHPNIIDLLDKYFIGFLSADNSYIIMRRIIEEGNLPKNIDTRYVNYNIYNNNFGNKYYILPNTIRTDIPVDIHIAEGIIDILSIYLNVVHGNVNGIFGAICGKSYSSIIRYLITNYGFICFNLHIYQDSDVDIKEMYRIKESLRPFNIQIFVHRNCYDGEKDYGVQKNRIIDNVIKI